MVFIFAISIIFNIQNRNNRQTISNQVKELEEQAIRDPLTDLYNRRFPFQFLEKEFARLNNVDGVLSIIIFDIDNFKHFNDTFGHACGDEILVMISNLLKSNFRRSDIICRYGGDEFFVAMSGSGLQEAQKKAEELQEMVMHEQLTCSLQKELQVTISIGIAAYPQHGESVSDVLKASDQALYQAKKKGKNRIEIKSKKI